MIQIFKAYCVEYESDYATVYQCVEDEHRELVLSIKEGDFDCLVSLSKSDAVDLRDALNTILEGDEQ